MNLCEAYFAINFCTSERSNNFAKFSKWVIQFFYICKPQKEGIKFSKSVTEITGFGENGTLVDIIDICKFVFGS